MTDPATFDAGWLTLREPLDEAARAVELTWAFGRSLTAEPRLIDLGSGTGSNLRHLAPRIGRMVQSWSLLERDPALLEVAPGAVAAWAGDRGWSVGRDGSAVDVTADGFALTARTRAFDLAGDLSALDIARQDAVTASALLDLVGQDWMERLADVLAAGDRPPVLFVLTVDGRVSFSDRLDDDAFILDRVDAHMRRDKGLGPALGGSAPQAMAACLRRVGYAVEAARADWLVGPGYVEAHRALIDGYAKAAAEVEPGAADRIAAWLGRRSQLAARGSVLTVGHADLFASR